MRTWRDLRCAVYGKIEEISFSLRSAGDNNEGHALERVGPSLARLIIDDVITTVGLVDVDLSLNCKMSSFNERCAERFSAERVRTFSAM